MSNNYTDDKSDEHQEIIDDEKVVAAKIFKKEYKDNKKPWDKEDYYAKSDDYYDR